MVQRSAAGRRVTPTRSRRPASTTSTRRLGSSERRAASTHPVLPPPTTTMSVSCVSVRRGIIPLFFFNDRCGKVPSNEGVVHQNDVGQGRCYRLDLIGCVSPPRLYGHPLFISKYKRISERVATCRGRSAF